MSPSESVPGARVARRCLAILVAAAAAAVASASVPSSRPSSRSDVSADWLQASRAGTRPTVVVEVLPALETTSEAPLLLTLRVTGDPEPESLRLYVRGEREAAFRSVPLEGTGSIRTARVPPRADRGGRVDFYAEADPGRDGAPVRVGSPDAPLAVELAPTRPGAPSALGASLGVLGAGALVLLGASVRDRYRSRRESRDREERFWCSVLAGFAGRSRHEFTDRLKRVCATDLPHPTRGRVRLERAEVLGQLRRRGLRRGDSP